MCATGTGSAAGAYTMRDHGSGNGVDHSSGGVGMDLRPIQPRGTHFIVDCPFFIDIMITYMLS